MPLTTSDPTISLRPSTHPSSSPRPTTTSSPTQGPKCEGSDPDVCGCASIKQTDYRGTISTTASGMECIRWDDYEVENAPDAGLEDNNYCRNPEPEWEESAFCYTADGFEYCDVPICEDSLPSAYPSASFHPTLTSNPTTSLSPTQGPQCEGSNPKVCGCGSVDQADYRGTINVTASGKECIKWDETEYYKPEDYPNDGLEDNNYCRKPGDWRDHVWCYTAEEDEFGNKRREDCDVPYCFPLASSCPSALDGNTDVSSMSEELKVGCAYHQCVDASEYELDDNQTLTRSEVKSDCACLFDVWDCDFGDGSSSVDNRLSRCEKDPLRKSDYECCVSKLNDSNSSSTDASCECFIKPDCEGGNSSKCNEFAENCCQEDDQQCKCEYQTKACRLALESDTEEASAMTYEYCGSSVHGGGAQDACCGEFNCNVGGCTCDFWEPLCTDFPNALGDGCFDASMACCGNSAHCSCDLFTHAVEALNYEEDEFDGTESYCAKASNIAPDHEVELQSLQSIYNEMSGDYWFNNTGWTTDQDRCNWFGITCDEQGFVIEINLPSNNVTGKFLSISLSSFYNLQRIVLGNNSLHGPMAGFNYGFTAFFNLRELTHVDLSQNNLSGEVDILFAPALQYANFSHNNFTSINSFKKFKRSQQTLTVCDVSHNSINTSASHLMRNVPPNIEHFILSSNLIHGTLPTLEVLANLRRFDMRMNSLSGEIPDFSNSYPNLQVLNLSNQGSSGGLVGNIPESLANLAFLSTLNLAGNHLSGGIPPVLGNMGQLRVLNLSSNKLSQTIPKELGKLGEFAHINVHFVVLIYLTCIIRSYTPSRS